MADYIRTTCGNNIKVLNTVVRNNPHPAHNRLHMVRLAEGGWGLACSCNSYTVHGTERKYQLLERWGTMTGEQAVNRWDEEVKKEWPND